MKIICETQSLCNCVTNVSKAVAIKSPLLAIEGILLKAENNKLTLTGYDLNILITQTIDCTVKTEGEIILNAKIFSDMVRNIDSDTITIEKTDNFIINILGGQTEYTILGIDANDFPEIPSFETENFFSLPQFSFKKLIRQTIFAVSQNENKPALTGVLFETENNVLTLASCDGCRLAVCKKKINFSDSLSMVIPSKTLIELSKMIKEDETYNLTIKIGKKHVCFEIEDCSFVSRLIENDFIDYKASIPQTSKTEVLVPSKSFQKSIEKTSLILTDKIKSNLKLVFEDNLIVTNCKTVLGNATDEIKAEIKGDSLTIGFNSKYLSDALKASECENLKISLSGSLSPMKIVPHYKENSENDEEFIFLVMPCKL